jgi:RimJ/RimL family protein N-acetyltransferase
MPRRWPRYSAIRYARRFYPGHGRREKLVGWIEWNLRNYEEHGYGLWALELLGDGTFVGDAGLTWQPVEGEWWLEIGYHIHPAQRRTRLATEAARACRDWAFANTDCAQVCSIVHPENAASLTVAGRVHETRRLVQSAAGDRWFSARCADRCFASGLCRVVCADWGGSAAFQLGPAGAQQPDLDGGEGEVGERHAEPAKVEISVEEAQRAEYPRGEAEKDREPPDRAEETGITAFQPPPERPEVAEADRCDENADEGEEERVGSISGSAPIAASVSSGANTKPSPARVSSPPARAV